MPPSLYDLYDPLQPGRPHLKSLTHRLRHYSNLSERLATPCLQIPIPKTIFSDLKSLKTNFKTRTSNLEYQPSWSNLEFRISNTSEAGPPTH